MPPLPPFKQRCLAVAIAQVLAISTSQAAYIEVSTHEDADAPAFECTLREAINNANNDNDGAGNGCAAGNGDDLIEFDGVVYDRTTYLTSKLPDIVTDLTINGHGEGHTYISGARENLFRIFNISSGATVSISNLTVTDGTATGNGGGINIINSSTVTLTNSTVSYSSSSLSGGGVYVSNGSSITLTGSTVSNNSATNHGGGIILAAGANVTLTESTVSENSATNDGGGIFSEGPAASITLTNSIIRDNSVGLSRDGGGIFIKNSGATLNASSVQGNTAYNGGGIYVTNNSFVHITSSTVSDNSAGNDGGGLFASGSSLIQVSLSTVSNNTANEGGGAMARFQSSVALSRSTVSGNSAGQEGGAVYVGDDGNATISNSTISGNSAFKTGGAIYVTDTGSSVQMENVTLSNNTSGNSFVNSNLTLASLFVTRSAAAQMHNTIIANSTIIANIVNPDNIDSDCHVELAAVLTNDGGNLVEDHDGSCGVFTLEGQDPKLGPLEDNGGETLTHALLSGSPAINAGMNGPAFCASVDQRLEPREDEKCDIGAFEYKDTGGFFIIPAGNGKMAIFSL